MKKILFYPFYIWHEENKKNKEIKKNLIEKDLPSRFLTAVTIQNHFIFIMYLTIYVLLPLNWLIMFFTGADNILFTILYSLVSLGFFLIGLTFMQRRIIPKMREEQLKRIGYYDIQQPSINDSEDQIK